MDVLNASIIIPTFNNFGYLQLCLDSLKKNSKFKHEVILHINDGHDGTLQLAKSENITYTYSSKNIGLCSSVNMASKKSTKSFILYAHDDMYFCPNWDKILLEDLKKIQTKYFYLSGSMIQSSGSDLILDCGNSYNNFNEDKFLLNYKNINLPDYQGSHWAPHLIHKDIWDKVNGFSEEFNPGIGSDPDLNMKLWKVGVRIFKRINNFKVYHFGSVVLRDGHKVKKNKGSKIFLNKWGISVNFFLKYFLKKNSIYDGPLQNPKKSINYYLELFLCKINLIFLKLFK